MTMILSGKPKNGVDIRESRTIQAVRDLGQPCRCIRSTHFKSKGPPCLGVRFTLMGKWYQSPISPNSVKLKIHPVQRLNHQGVEYVPRHEEAAAGGGNFVQQVKKTLQISWSYMTTFQQKKG